MGLVSALTVPGIPGTPPAVVAPVPQQPADQLIVITDGEPRTTTLAIAEGVGMEHHSVITLVRKYHQDLEEFGNLEFEIRNSVGAGRPAEYALLNEPQATLILTYMRNSEIVRGFKKRLVKAFYELKAQVETAPAAQSAFQVPQNYLEALKQLTSQVEMNYEQQKQLR